MKRLFTGAPRGAALASSERLHGCHRATGARVRARRAAFVEGLLDAVPVLPCGIAEALAGVDQFLA